MAVALIEPIVFSVVSDSNQLLPKKFSEKALGYDVFCPEDIILEPLKPTTVDLKIRVLMHQDYGLQIHARSSLASQGLVVLGGICDPDYRYLILL